MGERDHFPMSLSQSLAVLVLLVGTFQAHAACNCSVTSSCVGCVPVDEGSECFNQCQWCIPKLSCQQCPEVMPATVPPTFNCSAVTDKCQKTDSTVNAVIGPHQSFKCQDVQGDGPTLMAVDLTYGDSTVELWNGALPSGKSTSPTNISTFGYSSGSISIKGQHWGLDNAPAGYANQRLRLCPFSNMATLNGHPPVGPPPSSCFNCSAYSVNPPDLSLALCGFSDPKTKNTKCSSLSCSHVPAGIGQVSVFLDVMGEPASVVALQNALAAPGSSSIALASFVYAAPVITGFKVPKKACSLTPDSTSKCQARAGDNVTITADNLPFNMTIVETFNLWSPEQGLAVMIGNAPCLNIELASPATSLTCTLPVSSGGKLAVTLIVGSQTHTIPSLFYYPAPNVTSVLPASIPSYGSEITIKGTDFAKGGTVSLILPDGSQLPCSNPTNYTVSSLTCSAPKSQSRLTVDAAIAVSTLSGVSNLTISVDYKQCAFSTVIGGVCRSDGTQLCTSSFSCAHSAAPASAEYNQQCDFALASCECEFAESPCQNGGVYDKEACSCACVNGYSSSGKGGSAIPDTQPPGFYSGFCDMCETSCGTFDKEVKTAQKCGCEFNMLHLIWILTLAVLVLVAIGFGAFKYRQMKQKQLPVPLGEYLKAGDEEEEPRESRGDSTTYA